MEKISASIITIGDELLIGQVVDTNSAWMAQELNKTGVAITRRIAVGDDWQEIWDVLDQEFERSRILLLTGGLGPTADDITKPLLCEYFGGKMIVDQSVLQHVEYLFSKVYGRPMIERNTKQAEVPDVCTVLFNANGTAPGMLFEKNGRILVSMPGVPFEMKGIMQTEVLPMIRKRFRLPEILHRTLLTAGIGESFLAERIKDFEASLPAGIKLAYLPHYGMVRLRLSAINEDATFVTVIDRLFEELQVLISDVVVTNRDESLQKVVGDLLLKEGKTMSTAESCSGGYIAHLITSVAGSSNYYKGSVVSYDNDVKMDVLKVSSGTLEKFGAVSEETVREMVRGSLELLKTDYVLATSGIMGPGGGTAEKPVGTVWIAAGNGQEIITQRFKLRTERSRNIELTAINALNLLRKFILDQSSALKTNKH